MFSLGKHGPDGRYGVVVDIGSGSVGVAIVISDPTQKTPEILWSYRERMIIKDAESLSIKNITTTLFNVMLELGSTGILKLAEHEKGAKFDLIQVTISAPWSYTITKTVSYHHEEPFEITKKLIDELIATAEKQAIEAIDENGIIEKLGLETINKATLNLIANDYVVKDVYGQMANKIAISQVSAMSQKKIITAFKDSKDKVLPEVKVSCYSFMLMFYYVLQELAPDTAEVCLLDITSEATEIAIVRDGILHYVTHTPYGIYSLAREIAKICKVPKEEAIGYLWNSETSENKLSVENKIKFEKIVKVYEEKISELFARTGDNLSIPRTLFIHTDVRTEQFFSQHIKKAAKQVTGSNHSVHLVTSKLFSEDKYNDTAILLSAYFFHNVDRYDGFGLK